MKYLESQGGTCSRFTCAMGWTFDTEEVSAGVYRVRGVDEMGRSVEAIGIDPDALLEQCRKSAAQITEGNP